MSPGLVLVVVVAVMVIGALPFWPYSRQWGYAPAFGLSAMLVLVSYLYLVHRI